MTKIMQGLERMGKVESCGLAIRQRTCHTEKIGAGSTRGSQHKLSGVPDCVHDCVVFESFFSSITDEKL